MPCTATQRTTPASKTGRVIENPTCGRHAGRRLAQPRPHWTARPEHYDDTSPLASCRFHLIVAVAEGQDSLPLRCRLDLEPLSPSSDPVSRSYSPPRAGE
ncbi:hypothetical protein CMUS01_15658 [Colletotrichum musicola]|uniref:Uncharacterized protein n=1 Tax=Colletotrichum musicola TaxID=2175873 RepID=A0A8H6MM91_9PEZI|nr:hypothetical protein CMUS01_15658 [Colletotrichum musicola]